MIKRALDFTAALIGLILLSPLFVLTAALIKGFDRGPVFFIQRRVGLGGRPFSMFKFRSMRVDNAGPELTVGTDRRITPIGRILRRTKLDELPQLWNVLKGEMSLVGPRPEVERYVALYSEAERAVLQLKPGITDPASFAFYDESELLAQAADPELFYRTQLMPEKIRINLEYAAKADVAKDVFLILATVLKGFGVQIDVFRLLSLRLPNLRVTA